MTRSELAADLSMAPLYVVDDRQQSPVEDVPLASPAPMSIAMMVDRLVRCFDILVEKLEISRCDPKSAIATSGW